MILLRDLSLARHDPRDSPWHKFAESSCLSRGHQRGLLSCHDPHLARKYLLCILRELVGFPSIVNPLVASLTMTIQKLCDNGESPRPVKPKLHCVVTTLEKTIVFRSRSLGLSSEVFRSRRVDDALNEELNAASRHNLEALKRGASCMVLTCDLKLNTRNVVEIYETQGVPSTRDHLRTRLRPRNSIHVKTVFTSHILQRCYQIGGVSPSSRERRLPISFL
jgi:hypothetical protein